MTDIKLNDFILEVSNFLTPEQCNNIINEWKTYQEAGFCLSRQTYAGTKHLSKVDVDDDQVFSMHILNEMSLRPTTFFNFLPFVEKFWKEAYPIYMKKYGIISKVNTHTIREVKLQKVEVGGGYHIWHSENTTYDLSHRFLTFMIYLNDVEEGGETEFLYYPKRIKPETGKLILWPAGFTHTHRGNPPLTGEKYIITGWLEFVD